MSKGSRPRPIPDQQKFWDNWDKIFGSKEPPKPGKQPNKQKEQKRENNS
jgi:hypothetical protein